VKVKNDEKRTLPTHQPNLRFLTIEMKILLKIEDKCQFFFNFMHD